MGMMRNRSGVICTLWLAVVHETKKIPRKLCAVRRKTCVNAWFNLLPPPSDIPRAVKKKLNSLFYVKPPQKYFLFETFFHKMNVSRLT